MKTNPLEHLCKVASYDAMYKVFGWVATAQLAVLQIMCECVCVSFIFYFRRAAVDC
jgi:hypothetical protein